MLQTPVPKDTTRVLSEVLKNGRASLTSAGTVRFNEQKSGIAMRSYYHGLLPREDINKMLRRNGDFILRTTSVVDIGFNPQV